MRPLLQLARVAEKIAQKYLLNVTVFQVFFLFNTLWFLENILCPYLIFIFTITQTKELLENTFIYLSKFFDGVAGKVYVNTYPLLEGINSC